MDIKQFNEVMNSFDGYDTYLLIGDEKIYNRFNNSAFVSNYKRNDLLKSTQTIYELTCHEIERRMLDYKSRLTFDHIYNEVSPLIHTSNENARTIKIKVQHAIEELLYKELSIDE